MYQVNHLAEQHILRSKSHLKRIDELMARAQEARAKNAFKPEVETELARIQSARDKGEEELNAIQQQPSHDSADTVQRSEGLSGVLHTVGLELEKALTSVFLPASNADDSDGH